MLDYNSQHLIWVIKGTIKVCLTKIVTVARVDGALVESLNFGASVGPSVKRSFFQHTPVGKLSSVETLSIP